MTSQIAKRPQNPVNRERAVEAVAQFVELAHATLVRPDRAKQATARAALARLGVRVRFEIGRQ